MRAIAYGIDGIGGEATRRGASPVRRGLPLRSERSQAVRPCGQRNPAGRSGIPAVPPVSVSDTGWTRHAVPPAEVGEPDGIGFLAILVMAIAAQVPVAAILAAVLP